ncbi:phage holin family protein [Ornithinimicrobium sufpigmenti]|uniref:phage holin family protein n=1 Tax=Ornithinimicrobium sufpigmenti TaxID=2508882 RepID=UPI001036613A|nr:MULTISPECIES: phage holin family protein [unclassified Ornithinimicrobium]
MATPVDPAPQSRTDATSSRTLGQLVADVSTDISQIVRGELELAKLEIKQDVSHAGKGAGMLAGAAVFGLYGLGLLFLGLAGVIAIWLSWWAGLLIVAGVLFVAAGILALIGKNALQRVKGKPEKTIDQAQQTVDTLKGAAQSPHRAEIPEPVPPTRDGATAPLR